MEAEVLDTEVDGNKTWTPPEVSKKTTSSWTPPEVSKKDTSIPEVKLNQQDAEKNLVDISSKDVPNQPEGITESKAGHRDYLTRLPSEAAAHISYTPTERALISGTIDKFETNPVFKDDQRKTLYYQALENKGVDVGKIAKGVQLEQQYQQSAPVQIAQAPLESVKEGVKTEGEAIQSITPTGIAQSIGESKAKGRSGLEVAADVISKPIQRSISSLFELAGGTQGGAAFYTAAKALEKLNPKVNEAVNSVIMGNSKNLPADATETDKLKATLKDAVVGAIMLSPAAMLHGEVTPEAINETAKKFQDKTPEQIKQVADAVHSNTVEEVLKKQDIEKAASDLPENHVLHQALAQEHENITNQINQKEEVHAQNEAQDAITTATTEPLVQEKAQIENTLPTLENNPTVKDIAEKRLSEINNQLNPTTNEKSSEESRQKSGEESIQKDVLNTPSESTPQVVSEGNKVTEQPVSSSEPLTEEEKIRQEIKDSFASFTNDMQVNDIPTNKILDRMNNAENINEKEIQPIIDNLYSVLDKIDKREDLSDGAKKELIGKTENLINKVENYEFTTKTETRTTTERTATNIVKPIERKVSKPVLEQSEGGVAKVDGKQGRLKLKDGNWVIETKNQDIPIGERHLTNNTIKLSDNGIKFDENDRVKSVEFETKDGKKVEITNPQKALDIAIQIREQEIGSVPQGEFETIYNNVVKEQQVEVLKNQANETAKAKGYEGGAKHLVNSVNKNLELKGENKFTNVQDIPENIVDHVVEKKQATPEPAKETPKPEVKAEKPQEPKPEPVKKPEEPTVTKEGDGQKKLSQKIRDFANTKEVKLYDENGNEIKFNTNGATVKDVLLKVADLVELAEKAGEKITDFAKYVKEALKDADFYKDQSDATKKAIEDQISKQFEDQKKERETVSGISHRVLQKIGMDVAPSEGWSPEQSQEIGKTLLTELRKNNVDINSILFDKENTELSPENKAAVRSAISIEMDAERQKIGDTQGMDSKAYDDAKKAKKDFLEKTQYLGGTGQKILTTFRGETNLDTGSFTSLSEAFEEKYGTPPDEKQQAELKKLADENKKLKEEIISKNAEIEKNINNHAKTSTKSRSARVSEANAKIAEGIDALFSKIPSIKKNLLPEEKTKALDDIKKIISGLVEKGDIALEDAIKFAKDYIDKKYPNTFNKTDIDSKFVGEREVASLEKTLQNLEEGKAKQGNVKTKGEVSPELQKQIDDLKEKIQSKKESLGLIASKELPKTPQEVRQELGERFANKKDSKFTPQDIKDIFDYAKNYMDNPDYELGDAVHATAVDLGLTDQQVHEAFAAPKGNKTAIPELYNAKRRQRIASEASKQYLENANLPKWWRIVKLIPQARFAETVLGHGFAAIGTHANYIFRPRSYGRYFDMVKNTIKSSLAFSEKNKAAFDQRVEQFERSKGYDFALKHKLAIDPNKSYGDQDMIGKFMGKVKWLKAIGETGDRGFFELKPLRLAEFNVRWDRLPESLKTEDMAYRIAEAVNNSTGTTSLKFGKGAGVLNTALFAPKLAIAGLKENVSPIRAGVTGFKKLTGFKVSPEETYMAKRRLLATAEVLGTAALGLGANYAWQSMTGGKKPNLDDPSKPDFLLPVVHIPGVGDKAIDATAGRLSNARFLLHLFIASMGEQKLLGKKTGKSRQEEIGKAITQYLRGKLSPIGQDVAEVATKTDVQGNVVPYSSDIPKDKYHHQMTWVEYGSEKLPIPISGGLEDIIKGLKEQGMNEDDAVKYVSGLITFVVEGGAGFKVKEPSDDETSSEPVNNQSSEPAQEKKQSVHGKPVYKSKSKPLDQSKRYSIRNK